MSRATFRRLLLLLPLLACVGVAAAPPTTLGYQGRLASAGGIPVSATLSITFRLYDVPSGGTPLWTEIQSAIDVDGGNLAVELGSVTPLPASIWGRQLYLGVQVAGDGEMLPRPALTASPYALRAAATMKRTLVVSAEGTPLENGAALLAAVGGIVDASASSPVAVELDAGTFDLGVAQLQPPPHVTLAGRGQAATLLSSAHPQATILLPSHSTVRDLQVRNTGLPALTTDVAIALSARDPDSETLRQNISVERVTAYSFAASGSLGARIGMSLCVIDSQVREVVGVAEGGQFAMGLRMDCALSANNRIDGARLYAEGASDGVRGAYLAGSGDWSGLEVELRTTPGMSNVFGIRVLDDGVFGPVGRLRDSRVRIDGSSLVTTSQNLFISGVQVEYAVEVELEGIDVALHRVRGARVSGIRFTADSLVSHLYTLRDVDIEIDGVQEAALGAGGLIGLRLEGAMPHVFDADIRVRCEAGSTYLCQGIGHAAPGVPPATNTSTQGQTLRVEDVRVSVINVDPADGSAQTIGMQLVGPARVRNATVRAERSADTEVAFGIQHIGGALDLADSTIEQIDPSGPASSCAIGGGGSAELLGNVVQGQIGCGTGITVTCAATTRRGVGFVAAGCP